MLKPRNRRRSAVMATWNRDAAILWSFEPLGISALCGSWGQLRILAERGGHQTERAISKEEKSVTGEEKAESRERSCSGRLQQDRRRQHFGQHILSE